MTPAEKKKVTIAVSLIAVAVIVGVWRVFLSGGDGVSRDEEAAQKKVLERMQQQSPAPDESPNAPPPTGEPAGKPRSVRPGS